MYHENLNMPYSKHSYILCCYLAVYNFSQMFFFWQYCADYCIYDAGISDFSLSSNCYDVSVLESVCLYGMAVAMVPSCDNTALYKIFHSTRLKLFIYWHLNKLHHQLLCEEGYLGLGQTWMFQKTLTSKLCVPAQVTLLWRATHTPKHSSPLFNEIMSQRLNASFSTFTWPRLCNKQMF